MRLEPVGSDKKTPQFAARYDDLLKRVGAIPGVESASLVDFRRRGRSHIGVGIRRQHCGLQRRECGVAPHPALCGA